MHRQRLFPLLPLFFCAIVGLRRHAYSETTPTAVSATPTPAPVPLELLNQVAADHSLVLTEPPAVALFLGFGDSSLNFELRVWTNRFEQWVRIRSDVNVAINAALRDANITIPFPQRDVHLDSLRAVDVRIVDPKT